MSKGTRQTLALLCLFIGSAVFIKLAAKTKPVVLDKITDSGPSIGQSFQDHKNQVLDRYRQDSKEFEMVQRVLNKYAQTAINLESTDGLRGLKLLDTLDLEAVYLYEKHPREFRRLCELVDDQAAARILLTWRDYLSLKRADDGDRALWIAELERLSPSQRAIVQKAPEILPLMMTEPEAISGLVERMSSDPKDLQDALIGLQLVSLREGSYSLRKVIETLEKHPKWALESLRHRGPEGLMVMSLFGDVIESLDQEQLLDDSLIALHVSADDTTEYLRNHSAESVASHLRHLSAAGLLAKVADHPNALKLTLEFGERGEAAIKSTGADSAEVVYQDYSDKDLREKAVEALADHGLTAAVMLEKYASDTQFREILRRHGSAIILPIAQSDLSPELVAKLRDKASRSTTESLALGVMSLSGDSGQATIQIIHDDGLARVAQIQKTNISAVEFLPLYDLTHLANVLTKGYRPTSGEWSWALMDGAFVVADVMSLFAIQPEGVLAAEMTRGQVKTLGKTAAREGAESVVDRSVKAGLQAGEQVTASTARRANQWWAVRSAGGLQKVLKQMPNAMNRMTLSQVEEIVRPLARKAGVTLSRFEPLRFMKDGRELLMRVPPERGLKYLAFESGQAGVGLAAYWKMEEHLASRRSVVPQESQP
jgi:hypothetical protein